MERRENSETDLHVYNHLIYNENDTVGILASIFKKLMVLGQLDSYVGKKSILTPTSHCTQKSVPDGLQIRM